MKMNQRYRPSLHCGSVFVFLAVLASGCGQSADSPGPAQHGSLTNNRAAITISKATTYVTEPLNADGYPDYVAALNQIASEGVRPEENAAFILAGIVQSKAITDKTREAMFALLGAKPPGEIEQRFVDYNDYVDEHAPGENELKEKNGDLVCPADEQEQRAANGPWSEKDCPLVAQWLAANEKPLAAAIEASKRTQYYLPDFRLDQETDKDLREAVFATGGSVRYIAQALKARAMLRLHDEKINEAWDDLQACHRLSRLLGQGRKRSSDLILAMVTDGFAYDGQCRIAHFARMTPEQCAKFRVDVQNLTPLPWYAKASLSERFVALILACSMANGTSPTGVLNADDSESKTLRDRIATWTDNGALDWNAVLHLLNEWFDRLAAATTLPETLDRRKAILQLDMDLEAVRVATAKVVYSGDERPPTPLAAPQIASQMWKASVGSPIPLQERGERLVVDRKAAEIALALSEYRAEHGRYPDALNALADKCPAELLNDPYSGNELRYRRDGDGYTVYSVGPDGKDNGGIRPTVWSLGDDESLRNSDDVGIQMGIEAKHVSGEAAEPAQTDLAKNVENRAGVGDAMSGFSFTIIRPNGTVGKLTNRDLAGKVAVIQGWKYPPELAKFNELIAAYEKTDDPVVFVAVSANISELVVEPSPIKGDKPHLESKYQALLRAEAELLGRKHVYVAVDRALKEQRLMVIDTKGTIRVRTVGSGSDTDQWSVPKLKATIEELLEGK